MIILIPMGGKGSRFTEAGYKENKACILTTDRHSGDKLPMIICAMKDMPEVQDKNTTIICVDRDFHKTNGTESKILEFYPQTQFIHDHILLDQAYGCYLAKEHLNSEEELFIGTCDNGFDFDQNSFDQARAEADVLMISHTNDTNIEQNPTAHSWAKLEGNGKKLKEISLKKTVSDNPMKDHATTGMFWFKKASHFLKSLEKMIDAKDTFNDKYYVDKVIQYCIDSGLEVQIFDVNYLCWGTPKDYENYENTVSYWNAFLKRERGSKNEL